MSEVEASLLVLGASLGMLIGVVVGIVVSAWSRHDHEWMDGEN